MQDIVYYSKVDGELLSEVFADAEEAKNYATEHGTDNYEIVEWDAA